MARLHPLRPIPICMNIYKSEDQSINFPSVVLFALIVGFAEQSRECNPSAKNTKRQIVWTFINIFQTSSVIDAFNF
jgi:hypothetical protein